MIQTKKEVNSKIDWISGTKQINNFEWSDNPVMHNDIETLEQARKHYFDMLRRFLKDIEIISDSEIPYHWQHSADLVRKEIKKVFEKYDVHFVDVDDFPRINIDEPKQEN